MSCFIPSTAGRTLLVLPEPLLPPVEDLMLSMLANSVAVARSVVTASALARPASGIRKLTSATIQTRYPPRSMHDRFLSSLFVLLLFFTPLLRPHLHPS
jgi:hypothetical protein